MHAFEVLHVPVRRRILEHLATGEKSSGELVTKIRHEFGVSQPAVSQHLGVLRDNGFATVRNDGARRLYSLRPDPLLEVDAWLESFRSLWISSMEALDAEIERGKQEREAEQNKQDD